MIISAAAHCDVNTSQFDVSRSVIGMEPWIWWKDLGNLKKDRRNWQENVYYHEEWVCVLFLFGVTVLAWFVGDKTIVHIIIIISNATTQNQWSPQVSVELAQFVDVLRSLYVSVIW
jgi:hypothetical protein